MNVLEKAQDLQNRIATGDIMGAFEEYYADNVTVVEANGEAREGKEAQREAIQQWMGSVKAMHGGGIGSICANEETGTATAETWTDIEFQNGQRFRMDEVAVQKWEDGKIVHERFYYDVPPAQPGS